MRPSSVMPLPTREDLSIRPATLADIPFIDRLQKAHAKQVGWMPTQQLEGKIARREVLVAETRGSGIGNREAGIHREPDARNPEPAGYCISTDRYFKRDDVGIIYQMNIVPGRQRSFVGALLLKATFDRAAYGCKLFCCWCAQDIEANRFWEAMGFVPLAFRAGSEAKSRVHIFWQKRIRAGDAVTPYWFPSQTGGGSLREDRLVLPIPPGTHWSDAKPMVLPEEQGAEAVPELKEAGKKENKNVGKLPVPQKPAPSLSGLRFTGTAGVEKKAGERREKRKNDPRLVAAARELRDRWLEQLEADPSLLLGRGKYDVSRMITAAPCREYPQLPSAVAA